MSPTGDDTRQAAVERGADVIDAWNATLGMEPTHMVAIDDMAELLLVMFDLPKGNGQHWQLLVQAMGAAFQMGRESAVEVVQC